MSKRLKLALATGLAITLLAAVLVSSALAQGTAPYGWRGGGMTGGWRSNQPSAPGTGVAPYSGYGVGMMGNGMIGGWRTGQPTTAFTGTVPYYGGYGMTPAPAPGAATGVGGRGYGQPNAQTGQAPYGGYGRGMMGGGMMGGWRSR